MNQLRAAFVALLVVPLLCSPGVSLGCACCSEEGQYGMEHGKPSAMQIAEMEYIRFSAAAQLYVGSGDKEDVKGIHAPSYDYAIESVFDATTAQWRLSFRDENGNLGTLSLPLTGAKMSSFSADIHDGRKSAGGGPLLYKDWNFRGRASGSGIFKAAFSAPAEYTLIFQGRGNNCDGAIDFTHWRIEVRGRKADFTFVGQVLTPGAPDAEPNATPNGD